MRLLEATGRRAQALNGKLAQLRVLVHPRSFVGGELGETGNAVGLFHVRNHIALERGYVAFYRRQQIEVEASNIVVTRLSLASKTDSSCARHCGRSSQSGLPGGLIFASAKRGGDVSRGADGMGVPGFYSYAAMVTTAHGISYCISSRCAVRNSEQEVVVRS